MPNSDLDFEQVYTAFQPKVYRYLMRLIGSKDVEDVMQNVFIKVSNGLKTFNNQSQLSTWIYKIATNAAIDRIRSRSYKQEVAEGYQLIETDIINQQVTTIKNSSIEEQVVRKEMNDCIQECISILPANYRFCLILSEIEGLKNEEIATILGVSIGTVKIRLHRGRERLKQILEINCNFYETECCGKLACEQKGSIIRTIKPLRSGKTSIE